MFYIHSDIGVTNTVISATVKIFQVYSGGQLYWWRNPEYLAVTRQWQTLSHAFLSSTPCVIRTHNLSDDRHWLHWYFYIQLRLQPRRSFNKIGWQSLISNIINRMEIYFTLIISFLHLFWGVRYAQFAINIWKYKRDNQRPI